MNLPLKKLICLYHFPRTQLLLVNWKMFLPCHLELRHAFSTNCQMIAHSAFLIWETWRTIFLLSATCGCLSEDFKPANHNDPGTEQNHPRSATCWECFLFVVITEKIGWAIAQLPADWTNLILWRKPGRPKGLKPGKLSAKLLRTLRLGCNWLGEQNKGLWLAKLLKCY